MIEYDIPNTCGAAYSPNYSTLCILNRFGIVRTEELKMNILLVLVSYFSMS